METDHIDGVSEEEEVRGAERDLLKLD